MGNSGKGLVAALRITAWVLYGAVCTALILLGLIGAGMHPMTALPLAIVAYLVAFRFGQVLARGHS